MQVFEYYLTYQLEAVGGGVPINSIGIIQSQGNNIVLQELLGSGTANQGSTGPIGPTGATGPTGPSALSIALTNTNLTFYPTFVGSTGLGQTGYIDADLTYNPSTNTLTATNFNGNATSATNIFGGTGGQIPYQSAASTTAFLSNGTTGQYLVSNGGAAAPSWTTPTVTKGNFQFDDMWGSGSTNNGQFGMTVVGTHAGTSPQQVAAPDGYNGITRIFNSAARSCQQPRAFC